MANGAVAGTEFPAIGSLSSCGGAEWPRCHRSLKEVAIKTSYTVTIHILLTLRMLSQCLPQLISGLEGMVVGEVAFGCVTTDWLQYWKISELVVVFLRRDVHLEASRIGAVVGFFTHTVLVVAIEHLLLNYLGVQHELRHHRNGSWGHRL